MARSGLAKTPIVSGHDCCLQFGWSFDTRREEFIESQYTVANGGSHRQCFLDVGNLFLQVHDALVDDGALAELRALLAGCVLGKDRFLGAIHEGVTVHGAEGDVSDRAGEGLNRLIRVECYFSHSDFDFGSAMYRRMV